MKARGRVDSTGFQSLCNDLLRMADKPGVTFEHVLKDQTGKVLETCVKYTGSPKASTTPRKPHTVGTGFAKEGESELWITTGGPSWLVEPGGKGYHTCYIVREPGNMRHWSNDRWARGQRLLALADPDGGINRQQKRANKIIKGRGLAKASWVQIADSLGIPVKVPAFVRKAVPQDGIPRVSGVGRKMQSANSLFLEIENRYPLLCGAARKRTAGNDGFAILTRAIKTRVKAFEEDVKRGVFDDLKTRAQRYPGIFVKP